MGDVRTVGVEEELLLADAVSGELAPVATDLVGDSRADGRLSHEFKLEQVEITSDPCSSMTALAENVAGQRTHLEAVAAGHGVVACASGTSPLQGAPTVVPGERFARITDEFALMAWEQLTCGMHVHVSVRSPDEGIGVLDRIRGWLPILTALSVNSPFWQGIDSGYAGYRTVVLSQLPPTGPSAIWGSYDAYQRAVDQTIATGAAFDPGMAYFDARLSARFPTVEIRVTDVCRRVDDVVLIAALTRALVDTAAAAWVAGEQADDLAVPALRSASWRAARHGMTDRLYDPVGRRLAPAWAVVERLLAHVGDALRTNGDHDLVRAGLDRLRDEGTGADRQRRAQRAGESLGEVLLGSRITVDAAVEGLAIQPIRESVLDSV